MCAEIADHGPFCCGGVMLRFYPRMPAESVVRRAEQCALFKIALAAFDRRLTLSRPNYAIPDIKAGSSVVAVVDPCHRREGKTNEGRGT